MVLAAPDKLYSMQIRVISARETNLTAEEMLERET